MPRSHTQQHVPGFRRQVTTASSRCEGPDFAPASPQQPRKGQRSRPILILQMGRPLNALELHPSPNNTEHDCFGWAHGQDKELEPPHAETGRTRGTCSKWRASEDREGTSSQETLPHAARSWTDDTEPGGQWHQAAPWAPTAPATSQRACPGVRENKVFAIITLFHLDTDGIIAVKQKHPYATGSATYAGPSRPTQPGPLRMKELYASARSVLSHTE